MANGFPRTKPERRPAVRIEGAKVVLREKRLEDAEDDYGWRSDPELATFDAVSPLRISLADFLAIYKEELKYPSPRHQTLAIEDKEGKHIGNCMFYDVDQRKGQTELGIMIGRKEYWSQGYGTDAVGTLVRHVFETTALNRVYLHTLKWNTRAQAAFRKAGFAEIGEVTRNGQEFIVMEILRDQALGSPGETASMARVRREEIR